MQNLSATIAEGFINNYRNLKEQVDALAANLTEAQFWTRPYPYGNSFGHLTLHLIGNLNHYIGAHMANTGYVREREREFTESAPPAKEVVLARLDETVKMVINTLANMNENDWAQAYQAGGDADYSRDRFSMLLRCATHFQHHIGQMIYLHKEFNK